MVSLVRPKKKQALLKRALDVRIKRKVPQAVVAWAMDHLHLPESDMRRMKKLYNKAMDETITAPESGELDDLMDVCGAMDLLRARMLLGSPSGSKIRGK